jgi:hypothetical protein
MALKFGRRGVMSASSRDVCEFMKSCAHQIHGVLSRTADIHTQNEDLELVLFVHHGFQPRTFGSTLLPDALSHVLKQRQRRSKSKMIGANQDSNLGPLALYYCRKP